MQWHTKAFASQLGCLQLVEASRTLQFAEGAALNLLDTEAGGGGPVLYLRNSNAKTAVEPVCKFQPQGVEQIIHFKTDVSQIIPSHYCNKPVISLTVLEKYSCYFMQNAAPDDCGPRCIYLLVGGGASGSNNALMASGIFFGRN
jgi:hypothetical protein